MLNNLFQRLFYILLFKNFFLLQDLLLLRDLSLLYLLFLMQHFFLRIQTNIYLAFIHLTFRFIVLFSLFETWHPFGLFFAVFRLVKFDSEVSIRSFAFQDCWLWYLWEVTFGLWDGGGNKAGFIMEFTWRRCFKYRFLTRNPFFFFSLTSLYHWIFLL